MVNTRAKPDSVPQTVPTAKSQLLEAEGYMSGITHPYGCFAHLAFSVRRYQLPIDAELISKAKH